MMHAENEEEREAIKTLNQSGLNIAIYTAGRFDPVDKALRVRGPAFLDYDNLELPSKSELSAVATEAWKSGDESVTVGKWTFLIGRVALDDESCLGCHQANDPSSKPVTVGETAGMFMIAVQPKS